MKTESFVFAVVGIFGLVVGPIYGIVTDWQEPVGPVGLLLAAGLGFMVAFYFWLTGKRIGYRPDDNLDGNIDEAAGEYGDFTPHSWWPLWLGLTSSIVFLGLAVGWWVFAIGAFFGVFALVGWVFERYKGQHAM
ncbi:cytochrome c oxidase subunit 4 [Nostocoides veronense]|uniref:Cytochrome c oxidase polypeptide 4 n=1 Tax=Nostocoides veronense TaxID=330836 RepID=A0ABN2LC81_9MICO